MRSMYKIDRSGRGGGRVQKSYTGKLPFLIQSWNEIIETILLYKEMYVIQSNLGYATIYSLWFIKKIKFNTNLHR